LETTKRIKQDFHVFRVVEVESRYEDVNEFCENLFADNVRSPYLLAFMIDILEDQLETKSCQDVPRALCRAIEVHMYPACVSRV